MPTQHERPETPFDESEEEFEEFEEVEVPDFDSLKKPELVQFFEEFGDQAEGEAPSAEEFKKLPVGKMRPLLKALFPTGESLEDPDVTGLDASDSLHKIIVEVSNLKDETAVVAFIASRADEAECRSIQIGGALSHARQNGWAGDYPDFWEFVEQEIGLRKRKAQTLMQCYDALVECGVKWAEAEKVGWTKLRVVARVIKPDNYREWLKTAAEMSRHDLEQIVREALDPGEQGSGRASGDSTPIKKLSFSVHEDQVETIEEAIKQAKARAETEFDGQALELICLEFLGQSPASSRVAANADPFELLRSAMTAIKEKYEKEDPADGHRAAGAAVSDDFREIFDEYDDGPVEEPLDG